MKRLHISANDTRQTFARAGFGKVGATLAQGVGVRGADQFLLGGKMTVEAAMGQARARHQPGDADRLDTVASELLRRDPDDMLPCGVLMAFRVTHGMDVLPSVGQRYCITTNIYYDTHHAINGASAQASVAGAATQERFMSNADPIVIVAAARTPLGRFLGELGGLSAPALGAHVIRAALERARLAPERVDEALMGCVLPAGQGQAPARQAARGAGLPDATGATTVNKVCGSGMKATMLAHDLILAGSAEIVVAGGMESMSNAPYLLAKARGGYRMGHDRIIDHMMLDGLEDAYEGGRSMGDFGEATAQAYQFSRAEQDAYAVKTLTPRQKAIEDGAFAAEIAPIAIAAKGGDTLDRQRREPAQSLARQNSLAETRLPP